MTKKRKKNQKVKLNFHDFTMLAMEGVSSAHSQLIMIRFKTKHTVKQIREGMRYMLKIYPKLRALIEPTMFSYRFNVLENNDNRVDVLFNQAFRVIRKLKCDTESYYEFRRDFLNEPSNLEQAFPIKMRYLPDNAMPMLLVSMHHVACDGVGWFHMENSLLDYLNGKKPPLVPLDNPSMRPAFLGKISFRMFKYILKSFGVMQQIKKEARGSVVIPSTSRPINYYGPVDIKSHTLSFKTSKVSAKSKELGTTVLIMIVAAYVSTFSKGPGRNKGNEVAIFFPIDLRPFYADKKPVFGNYVSQFILRIRKEYWNKPKEMIKEINTQLTTNIDRFKNKEMCITAWYSKIAIMMGKKNYQRSLRFIKEKGLLNVTGAFSTLGRVDVLNQHGPKAQIAEPTTTTPLYTMFMTNLTLGEKIIISFGYQEAEFTREEMNNFVKLYEKELGNLLKLK